jgi:hypothetical protein
VIAVEPTSNVLALTKSARESVMQTSSFVAINHRNTLTVWIIDPLRQYAFLRKFKNYVEIEEPKWKETK